MSDTHEEAFLDLLRADPNLAVFDSKVPDGSEPPYVLVYVDPGTPDVLTLKHESVRVTYRATLHNVGGNADAARIVARRSRAALLDVTPTVTGRSCRKIRHEVSQPAQRDESTGQLVMDLVEVYRLQSDPAG